MKSRIVRATLVMSALLVFGIAVVFAQPKGDTVKVTVEGTAVNKGGTQVIHVSPVK